MSSMVSLPPAGVIALYQLKAGLALTVLKRIELLDKREGIVSEVSDRDIKSLKGVRELLEYGIIGGEECEVFQKLEFTNYEGLVDGLSLDKALETYGTLMALLELLGYDFKNFTDRALGALKVLEVEPSLKALSEEDQSFVRVELREFLEYLKRCSDLIEDEDY